MRETAFPAVDRGRPSTGVRPLTACSRPQPLRTAVIVRLLIEPSDPEPERLGPTGFVGDNGNMRC